MTIIEFLDFQFCISCITLHSYLSYPFFSVFLYFLTFMFFSFFENNMKKFLVDLMTRLSHNTIHQPVRYCWAEQHKLWIHFSFWSIHLSFSFFLEKTAALIPCILFITKPFSLDTFTKSTSWITSNSLTVCWEKVDGKLHRWSTIIPS